MTYKSPKDYKPVKANEAAARDKAYLVETFGRLSEATTALLLNPSTTASKLTGPEHRYYAAVGFLSAFLRAALEAPRSGPAPGPGLSAAAEGYQAALDALRGGGSLACAPPGGGGDVFYSLAAGPHALSLLRDAALAGRRAASLVAGVDADAQARDRSGRSGPHRDALARARGLGEAAAGALREVGGRVGELGEALGQGGWLDRMAEWTFRDGDGLSELVREVVGEAEVEEWGAKVVESWREGVKGLGLVKME